MSTVSEKWVTAAQYDLTTARDMLDAERYAYVLYCCQQAVEKLLKGLISKQARETPPPLNNLVRLAELTDLKLDEDRTSFLKKLSGYHAQMHGIEETDEDMYCASPEMARTVLQRTENIMKRLRSAV